MNRALQSLKPNSRILLVEPPFYRFFGYERWHYPITLTLVGTYLEQQGHFVRIFDADKPTPDCRSLTRLEVMDNYPQYEAALSDREHPIWEETLRVIKEFNPDVVGLTSITAKIDSANIIAAMIRRELGRDIIIMLGGAHVQGMLTMHPEYDFGDVYDFVVPRIPEIIRLRPNKKLIMQHETYSAANFSGIMTSTGCPNTCTFCCHSFEKSLVYRNINDIRMELEEIKDRYNGAAPIYIMDDCFFSNTKHFRSVSALLNELQFQFTAGSRIMALTPEKIELFAQQGGIKLLVGVESGSQRILDKVEKRLRIEEIISRTRWLNKAGIPWSAFFVVGFPFETIDDLKRTEELIQKIRPSFVSMNRFTPYPGTQIYKEYFAHKTCSSKIYSN
ncbi:B12-binding domain-containing radical SAM protein [Geotalea toluenoxydans]|uniref:B12-binding domain-containing radical SAM protein n=1 Tax=Geotalea toluenoxydans TaxID=421624 RepID=UPI000B2FD4C6|nr:radical SAM protein [Geotalea toluenoxydans]